METRDGFKIKTIQNLTIFMFRSANFSIISENLPMRNKRFKHKANPIENILI